jgi:Helix-turn-helix.
MKQARLRAGISQFKLAAALMTSQATVSRLESGTLIATFDDLTVVAELLETPVETLLGSSTTMARRYRWAARQPNVRASRRLATALPAHLVVDFVALGGSLRALHAAREGRQPLTAPQAAILLSLGLQLEWSTAAR